MRPVVLALGLALTATATIVARQHTPTFRSVADVVVVPAAVLDGNTPVAGLRASDFVLLDNGVAQQVSLSPVSALALDVTLVLDVSGSVSGRALEQFREDIRTIGRSLHPNDRVRLLPFASTIVDPFGLQPGGADLPVEQIKAGGATSFYNALATALMLAPRQTERPQLIFALTDGRDSSSFIGADRIVELSGRSGASLFIAIVQGSGIVAPFLTGPPAGNYVAGQASPDVTPFAGGPNMRALRDAAARTGGSVHQRTTGTPTPQLFLDVLDEFRSSYVLTYSPSGVARPGWHEITVRTANTKHTIRARKGYDGGA